MLLGVHGGSIIDLNDHHPGKSPNETTVGEQEESHVVEPGEKEWLGEIQESHQRQQS